MNINNAIMDFLDSQELLAIHSNFIYPDEQKLSTFYLFRGIPQLLVANHQKQYW